MKPFISKVDFPSEIMSKEWMDEKAADADLIIIIKEDGIHNKVKSVFLEKKACILGNKYKWMRGLL